MLNIGLTKLQLDDAVGGEEVTLDGGEGSAGPGRDDKTAKEVRKSLLTTLRHKFEAGGEDQKMVTLAEETENRESTKAEVPDVKVDGRSVVKKKARAGASQPVKEED
jgi:SWI/SNF-related matrix-associated actin-dependent regulator 1 of chromatin subfamily A